MSNNKIGISSKLWDELGWSGLPGEVLEVAFGYLGGADLCSARLVCQGWRDIAEGFMSRHSLGWRWRCDLRRPIEEREIFTWTPYAEVGRMWASGAQGSGRVVGRLVEALMPERLGLGRVVGELGAFLMRRLDRWLTSGAPQPFQDGVEGFLKYCKILPEAAHPHFVGAVVRAAYLHAQGSSVYDFLRQSMEVAEGDPPLGEGAIFKVLRQGLELGLSGDPEQVSFLELVLRQYMAVSIAQGLWYDSNRRLFFYDNPDYFATYRSDYMCVHSDHDQWLKRVVQDFSQIVPLKSRFMADLKRIYSEMGEVGVRNFLIEENVDFPFVWEILRIRLMTSASELDYVLMRWVVDQLVEDEGLWAANKAQVQQSELFVIVALCNEQMRDKLEPSSFWVRKCIIRDAGRYERELVEGVMDFVQQGILEQSSYFVSDTSLGYCQNLEGQEEVEWLVERMRAFIERVAGESHPWASGLIREGLRTGLVGQEICEQEIMRVLASHSVESSFSGMPVVSQRVIMDSLRSLVGKGELALSKGKVFYLASLCVLSVDDFEWLQGGKGKVEDELYFRGLKLVSDRQEVPEAVRLLAAEAHWTKNRHLERFKIISEPLRLEGVIGFSRVLGLMRRSNSDLNYDLIQWSKYWLQNLHEVTLHEEDKWLFPVLKDRLLKLSKLNHRDKIRVSEYGLVVDLAIFLGRVLSREGGKVVEEFFDEIKVHPFPGLIYGGLYMGCEEGSELAYKALDGFLHIFRGLESEQQYELIERIFNSKVGELTNHLVFYERAGQLLLSLVRELEVEAHYEVVDELARSAVCWLRAADRYELEEGGGVWVP